MTHTTRRSNSSVTGFRKVVSLAGAGLGLVLLFLLAAGVSPDTVAPGVALAGTLVALSVIAGAVQSAARSSRR